MTARTNPGSRARRGAAAAMAALLTLAGPLAGQARPLTLDAALDAADGGAYANRIAQAEVRVQEGTGMQALRGILPTLRLEAGWLETTDAIGAFGIGLRQRSITAADFDPARLNHPDAATNWTGGVVLEQPLLNLDAWLGRRAARDANGARAHAATWAERSTRTEVVRAYYGAVLAQDRVATLAAGLEAAQGHVRRAESLAGQGLVTRSDALLASVSAGEIEADLIAGRGDAVLAKRGLALLLGAPEDTAFALPTQLPSAERIAALVARVDRATAVDAGATARADVRAAERGAAAARADRQRAQALWLPRLNGIARLDWNSPDAPFDAEENWSVGVMATWTPFAGAGQLAELRATSGRAEIAAAQSDAARAQAELDVAARENDWRVAQERLRIASRAVEQGEEARRIVERKYEGGLAAVVELLSASATATQARLRESQARFEVIASAAALLQSIGLDPALLAEWAAQS